MTNKCYLIIEIFLNCLSGSRTLVTTSVIKDGNVFSVHLTNPRVENAEILKQNDEEYRDAHAVHGTIKTAKDAVALLEEHKQHRKC